MKTNLFTHLTAILAAILSTPAFAIEAPADDAPPPPVAETPPTAMAPATDAAQPAAKAQAGFLGVVCAEVPAMLAEHLGLQAGEGILVRALMPEGPAAKAGVTIHDIITRVAGQPIGSSLDLTKRVATCKPGETINLDLIHHGKPAAIDVTLGTRPEGITAMDPRLIDPLNLDEIPRELADRIHGAIEGKLGKLDMNIEEGLEQAAPHMQDAVREMKNRIQNAMEGLNRPNAPGGPNIEIQQGATFRLMDEQGSIELKANEEGKEVTLRDKDNQVTWNGPWDTEQDKAAAPDEVRQRVDRLNLDSKFEGNGLRFHLRQGNDPNDRK